MSGTLALAARAVRQEFLKQLQQEAAGEESLDFHRALLYSLMNYLSTGREVIPFEEIPNVPSKTRMSAIRFVRNALNTADSLALSRDDVGDAFAKLLVWAASKIVESHLLPA